MSKLTQEIVRELITYDPSTGECWWKERDVKWFKDGGKTKEHSKKVWNVRFSGKETGTYHEYGYKYCSIFKKSYKLHRLIWFYMTGEWPNVIDHINGINYDNRWCNLRNVTQLENSRNAKKPNTNTSGFVGVTFDKSRFKWLARIHDGAKMINLGRFEIKQEAIDARKQAEIKYGYHPNHGRE